MLFVERLQEDLGIEDAVSQSILNRFPGRMNDRERTYYASETETLVRQWQDTPYEEWVRNPTPETVAPDGEGVPPVQTLVRELRAKTFPYIRVNYPALLARFRLAAASHSWRRGLSRNDIVPRDPVRGRGSTSSSRPHFGRGLSYCRLSSRDGFRHPVVSKIFTW